MESTPKTVRVLATVVALVLVVSPSGCDKAGTGAGPEAPSTRKFELDKHVRYVYRDPVEGLRPAASLQEIPREQRAATILYGKDESAEQAERASVYVADLLGASMGDTVEAKEMTLRAHFQRARAAERGAWHARMVSLAAQDQAQLDRRSERTEASREARELLDKIVPRETRSGTNQPQAPQ